MRQDAGENLTDRLLVPLHHTTIDATPAEERVYAILAALRNAARGRNGSDDSRAPRALLQYGLYKQFLSSPESCRRTVHRRMATISAIDPDSPELTDLERLAAALSHLTIHDASRYRLLTQQLRDIGWNGSARSPRLCGVHSSLW